MSQVPPDQQQPSYPDQLVAQANTILEMAKQIEALKLELAVYKDKVRQMEEYISSVTEPYTGKIAGTCILQNTRENGIEQVNILSCDDIFLCRRDFIEPVLKQLNELKIKAVEKGNV